MVSGLLKILRIINFEARKKALPIMQKAFEVGKKVKFTKGKLYVEGNVVPL